MTSVGELMERAAAERAHEMVQRVDRPRQRRSNERIGASAGARMPATCELRTASADPGAPLEFHGHATTFEQGYEMYDFFGPYTEIVSSGAADVTLAQTSPPLDVTLNLGHDQLRRIASTIATDRLLSLSVDQTGLAVEALALDPEDYDVRYIAPKLRSGLITEMSFAFRIIRGQWSPDYTEYRIEQFDLHRGDVAIVGYGANPTTDGALRKGPKLPAVRSGVSARALLELTLTD
jgi:hypothetical protein